MRPDPKGREKVFTSIRSKKADAEGIPITIPSMKNNIRW
jgi:hypothetical protein